MSFGPKVPLAVVAALLAASVAVDLPPWGPVYTPPTRGLRAVCEPPASLADAHVALGRLLPGEIVGAFARGSEDAARRDELHLGPWMREFWGLWRGGALRAHLVKLGLRHPDDKSELVLVTWWRVLNDRPPDVAAEAARVRSSERWRPDPQCRCSSRGPCATQNYIRSGDRGVRAFVVSGCCCGGLPQVAEGTLVQTNGYTFVFPIFSASRERNQACAPGFEAVREARGR
ncbi:MAG: DUF6794 domain-containing protein [Vicinamibacteria bacterium]